MDKKSKLEEELAALSKNGALPDKHYEIALENMKNFRRAFLATGLSIALTEDMLRFFFQLVLEQIRHPHSFESYHQKVRHPIDYYKFSLDFFRPLIDLSHSRIEGRNHLDQIITQLKNGENVVFFANHQTESDPQALALLWERDYPKLAQDTIYVAGERVVTDPLAIPFSLGTDLLCIYSKRYELTPEKLHHNQRTMDLMSRLLKEGGKAIYVAPSGGRDRKNSEGKIIPAPFDPSSVELFYLMAKKAKTPTHFYPLALDTYNLLPPPETVQVELGEERIVQRTPIQIAFGPECNMEYGAELETKEERRKAKTEIIWKTVCNLYEGIT
jgi:glycerol-3-phosphate O-acyltransferase